MSSCEQQDVNGNFSISSQYYHSPNHANDDSSNGDTKIKPKRPRTAYNYFFSEERTKILSIESPITELEENKLGYSNSDFQSLYPYENQIVKLSDAAAHMSSKRKYSDEKVSFEKIGKMIYLKGCTDALCDGIKLPCYTTMFFRQYSKLFKEAFKMDLSHK